MAKRKSKTLRVGLIGCGGNMCHAHVPRINPVRGVDIVAATDTVGKQIERARERTGHDLEGFADYRRMVRAMDLDAVVISTPHSQHYEQIRHCIKAGLHVLVEKPMTTTSAHARALLKLAKAEKKILHVAYQRHHYPLYVHIRDLIANKKIGTLRSVTGYVTQNWCRVGGWRIVPELSGGGMFMDTGSHLVAASLFLSQLKVREVHAVIDNAGRPVDINASVAIRYEGDAIGNLTTIGNALHHDESLCFHGDTGLIVIHQHEWKVTRALMNNEPIKLPKSIKEDDPDAAFFRWIKTGKGYMPPRYVIEVAHISELAYRSAAAGRKMVVRKTK